MLENLICNLVHNALRASKEQTPGCKVGVVRETLQTSTEAFVAETGTTFSAEGGISDRAMTEADIQRKELMSRLVPSVQVYFGVVPLGICIRVTDKGVGIEASQIPLLTEPFYRVDKARSRKNGGIGLGLTICKLIAEVHGGTLSIQSVVGEGTVVEVILESATI